MTHSYQMVLAELTTGFAFALPFAAMCTYVYVLAPQGMTATLMSLTQGVYWGLGKCIISIIGMDICNMKIHNWFNRTNFKKTIQIKSL